MNNQISKALEKKFGITKPVFPNSTYKVFQIPKKTFRKYTNNELQPRLDELERIADWLGVEPKDLF